jgi:hypothetical protein
VKFPARPGLSLRFCTDTVGEEGIAHYPPLLERDAKGWTLRRLQCAARLRARERRVGPFAGQELVKQVVDLGGGQGWNFTWECLGRPRDPLAPMMLLELRASPGRRARAAPGPIQAGEETFRMWDAVLGSLRRRDFFLRSLRLPDAFRSS